jgi:hypothetical protein
MQETPKSVQATVDSINAELRKRPDSGPRGRRGMQNSAMTASKIGKRSSGLTPNDTNLEDVAAVIEKMVDPGRDRSDDLFHAMELSKI